MRDPWDALSDPTRREILLLLRGGQLNASKISQEFPFTKSTVSRHLEVLEDSGLILSEKRKQFVYYSLNPASFEPLKKFIASLEEPPGQLASPPVRGQEEAAPSASRRKSKGAKPVIREPESGPDSFSFQEQKATQGETEAAVQLPVPPSHLESPKSSPPSRRSQRGRVPSYLD